MRYVGQEHAVTVELPIDLFTSQDRDGIKKLFDAVHQTRYGFSVAGEKAEIVSLRGAVIGEMRKPPFEHIAKGGAEPDAGGVPRQAAGVFRQHAASSRRRPMTGRRSRPATRSPGRR